MRPFQAKPSRFDWVLVANAARARCYVRDAENLAMREIQSFVHPASRLAGRQLDTDRPGQVLKSSSVRTQFDPHTDPHAKEHQRFAREIAHWLEEAALAQRFEHLALFASSAFLGELRKHLGAAATGRLQASVASDLTAFADADLEQRVAQALTALGSP